MPPFQTVLSNITNQILQFIAFALSFVVGSIGIDAISRLQSADAHDPSVIAIEKLGGSIRPLGDDWEIDFHLRGRDLTDDGLAHIARFKNVVSLNLKDTKITGAGLVHLKGLSKLRWLHLERTEIDDDGIKHLTGLGQLEYLNLYKTKITDKSLDHLTRLHQLKRLYVWQTAISNDGAKRLEKALPKLKVIRGVDLNKLPSSYPREAAPPKPTRSLKWIAVSSANELPQRSTTGTNVQVFFENKSKLKIKLYWISYGGERKQYAEIESGKSRQQNTYSNNAWLITDESEKPLGYFIVGPEDSLAVIPQAN